MFSGFDTTITGISLSSNPGGWTGTLLAPTFTASSITFSPHADLSGFTQVVFNIQTQTQTAGVPDGGATAAMLGLAFAGLGALRRKLGG